MTLQDQRVISTSAFRCVGNVLRLHGQIYSPPYEVRAIGDPDALLDALHASPEILEYLDYVDAIGLGWSVEKETDLDLAAFAGNAELRYAAVPEGQNPGPSARTLSAPHPRTGGRPSRGHPRTARRRPSPPSSGWSASC